MYSSTAYAPFGETYAQAGTADPVFAGISQDTSGGLYDADAREYSTQGRWPSPDPAGASSMHLSDPQTLNRYVYSRNNPLSLTDPSGRDWCDWLGGCDGGGWGGGMGCDWDPSCFGGSLPPIFKLPDPFGISNYPMPGMGCDPISCDDMDNLGNWEDAGGGRQKTAEQCVANAVNQREAGRSGGHLFTTPGSLGEQGGHFNTGLRADGMTEAQAQAVASDLNQGCDPSLPFGYCITPFTRLGL